jgi:hypothetical protein
MIDLRNGREAAFLMAYRRLSPHQQQAVQAALERCQDGLPLRETLVKMLIEWGDAPDAARVKVKEVLDDPHCDWRAALD